MKEPHVHSEIIHAFAEGDEIQWNDHGTWRDIDEPRFCSHIEYRVKPPEDPYQHLKEAHARGEKIEYYLGGAEWEHIPNPTWIEPVGFYRIAAKKELPPKHPYSQESWIGEWVKNRNALHGRIQRVLTIQDTGIWVAEDHDNRFRNWRNLLDCYEWSTSPNGPWNPCYL